MPGTFKAYAENLKKDSGKSLEDFWKLAVKTGFIKRGKIVARHADLLLWLKTGLGLGHVRANFVILYLRIRARDPGVTKRMKDWAINTG